MTITCTQCTYPLEEGAAVCAGCGAAVVEPLTSAAEEEPVPEAMADETHAAQIAPVMEPVAAEEVDAGATQAAVSTEQAIQAPVSPPMFSSGDDLTGIGGWLLLSAFGLAFAPFLIGHGVYGDLKILFGARYQPGLKTHPGLSGLLMFESVTNSMFLAGVLGLNYLLYSRKKSFPGSMVAYFIAQIVWVLTDHLMAMHYTPQPDWTALMRSVVTGVVWIPYYLQSRRVELTFVND